MNTKESKDNNPTQPETKNSNYCDSLNANTLVNHQSIDCMNIDIKQVIDNATVLIQTIISEKLSDKVIKKMPANDYLALHYLLNKMIRDFIDNRK